jgi:hypothetical protein
LDAVDGLGWVYGREAGLGDGIGSRTGGLENDVCVCMYVCFP